MSSNLVITIMAAGEGKRMNSDIPKILHKFNDTPMIVRIIQQVMPLNANKYIIITGKFDKMIQTEIQKYLNKEDFDKLIFVQQKNPKGTGDAIRSCIDLYDESSKVLILNGDMPLIRRETIEEFIVYKNQNSIFVAELENPFGYGRIIKKNNFIQIVEEKDCDNDEKNIKLVNVGIYFINGSLLKKYIPTINNNNKQNEYYLTDIVEIIQKNENIPILTYTIEQKKLIEISGVNTQQELIDLEKKYINYL